MAEDLAPLALACLEDFAGAAALDLAWVLPLAMAGRVTPEPSAKAAASKQACPQYVDRREASPPKVETGRSEGSLSDIGWLGAVMTLIFAANGPDAGCFTDDLL